MESTEVINIKIITGKYEDATAKWFRLSYIDVELYCVLVEDAYRTPWSKIMNRYQLDSFLEEFTGENEYIS